MQSTIPEVGPESTSQTSQDRSSENRGARSVADGTGRPHDNGLHNRGENDRTARTNTFVIRNVGDDAPNISLNLENNESRTPIKLVALMGIILQAVIVVIFGIMTYHPGVEPFFRKDDKVVAKHAFPLAAGGTIMVVAGLFLCARVVETSTVEERYETTDDYEIMIYWLQQGQTVGDQVFESFAIFPSSPRTVFITSRRNPETHERIRSITLAGVAIALSGFILQFVGMRAMNSVASLAQLGAIFLMTVSRALVRPGFASSFQKAKLLPGFELDWLAWKLVNTRYSLSPGNMRHTTQESHGLREYIAKNLPENPSPSFSQPQEEILQRHQHLGAWIVATGEDIDYRPLEKISVVRSRGRGLSRDCSFDTPPDVSNIELGGIQTGPSEPVQSTVSRKSTSQLLAARRGLSQLANFQGTSSKIALGLSLALEKTLTLFFPEAGSTELNWYVNTKYLGSVTPRPPDSIFGLHIKPFHNGTSWKVMADDLDSVLSLWSYTVRGEEQSQVPGSENSDDDSWLRNKIPRPSLRLFRPSDHEQFKRDVQVWAPKAFRETLLNLVENTHDERPSLAKRRRFLHSRVTGFTHRYEPQESVGTETPNRCFSTSRRGGKGENPPENFTWGVESHDPLELVYAKDLLFSFLCSAAQMLEGPLKGRSTRPTTMANRPFDGSEGHLQNETLDRLAAYLVGLGFGTEDEVYLAIATPLSICDRLPIPVPFFESRCTQFIAARKAGEWSMPRSMDRILPNFCQEPRIMHYHVLALMIEFIHVTHYELQLITTEKLISPKNILIALEHYVNLVSKAKWDLQGFTASLRKVYSFQLRDKDPIDTLETSICTRHGLLQTNLPWQCIAANSSFQHAQSVHTSMTPLHLKVIEYQWPTMEYYVDWGLSTKLLHLVNERDICGLTPLHYACILGNLRPVVELLNGGADATLKDFRAYTPLHCACSSGLHLGIEGLLEAGALFDDQGIDGACPTHLAAAYGHTNVINWIRSSIMPGKPELVPVDIWRKKDFKGRIALHWAAMHGQCDVIKMLKGDVDEEDDYGLTALHLAVLHDQCDVIKTLTELKADRDKKDKIGRTALKIAYQHERQEAIQLLRQAEAEMGYIDNGIKTQNEQWFENIKAFRRAKRAAGKVEAESTDTEPSEHTMKSEGILLPWLQTIIRTERESKSSTSEGSAGEGSAGEDSD